jgi:hypothetical protein
VALVKCPDCGRDVSDQAPACIGCGRPSAPTSRAEMPYETIDIIDHDTGNQRLSGRPQVWPTRLAMTRLRKCGTSGA